MKRFSPTAAMLLVAALVATSCASAPGASTPSGSQAAAAKPKPGGTIRYGLVRDPIHFDPAVSAGQSRVSLQVASRRLVEYNDRGSSSALARRAGSPPTPRHTSSSFEGVTFHDGSAFDAEDVIAT